MRIEFRELAKNIIELARNRPIIYVTYDGNWGDALIRQATISFFEHFNIKFTEIKLTTSSLVRNLILFKAKQKGQLIVMAGGGAWCGNYQHAISMANSLMSRYKFNNLLVLPSSYDKEYRINNVIFYCRDKFESQTNMPNAKFCHDMAFFLEPLNCATSPIKSVANCFRVDIESKGEIELPENNYDLSSKGKVYDDIYEFLNYISQYKTINTDRLHVAIAASILGKEVNVYEGSYFKNRAIFDTSLANTYPETKLIRSQ